MTKEELLSLAGKSGGRSELIRKIRNKENKSSGKEAAEFLNNLLIQHNIGKAQLRAAYNPVKRAKARADFAARKNTPAVTPTV